MSIIIESYKQAELALAAYASLTNGISGKGYTDALEDSGKGMSPTQAADFASKWLVIDQYNGASGISATVFQAVSGGPKYLAIRGTEPSDPGDAAADLDVLVGTDPRAIPQYQFLRGKVTEWLANGTLSVGFTATGHSLGGFLAATLTADLPNVVGHAYLYNAPGFGGAVGRNVGIAPNAALVSNIKSSTGLSPIAGLGVQAQPIIGIATEDQLAAGANNPSLALNHDQGVLTDALAVYDLFARTDASVSLATIGTLLKAASNKNADTLETATKALGKLILGSEPTIATDNRDALYQAIGQIKTALGNRQDLSLVSLASQPASTLAGLAKNSDANGLAYRYALKELNPFAVLGADYSAFNQNGRLDHYDPATGSGELTDAYLTDRAAFLSWKNKLALTDTDAATVAYSKDSAPDAWFKDNASGLVINLGNQGAVTDKRRFIFDDDTGNTLSGGSRADNLYGGGGDDVLYGYDQNDTLEGGQGADTLTGGSGNDTLKGGAGSDTYLYATGDGQDTLIDADGQGKISYDGLTLGAGTDTGDNRTYRFTDAGNRQHTYLLLDGSSGGKDLLIDDKITVKHFKSGDLGIALNTAQPPAQAQATIEVLADQKPLEFRQQIMGACPTIDGTSRGGWGSNSGLAAWIFSNFPQYNFVGHLVAEDPFAYKLGPDVTDKSKIVILDAQPIMSGPLQIGIDYLYTVMDGNAAAQTNYQLMAGGDQPVVNSMLINTDHADHIIGGDGADMVQVEGYGFPTHGNGDDLIETHGGNDQASGGAGNDVLIGGDGEDGLSGGDGNDQLYADERVDITQAITNGNSQSGNGTQEMLFGGAGNDTVVGDAGSDWLEGDGGNDLLIGGAGDDDISGDNDIFVDINIGLKNDPSYPTRPFYAESFGGTKNPFGPGYSYPAVPTDGAADVIYAGAGNDVVWGGAGDDVIFGEAGADRLSGDDGKDVILGGEGDDVIYGDGSLSGDLFTYGLYADTKGVYNNMVAGDDYLDGGAGNNSLYGGAGNDTYVFEQGSNNKVYDTGDNTYRFGDGFDPSTLKLRQGSLVLDFGAAGEVQLMNVDWQNAVDNLGESSFEFADGTTLSAAQLLARGFDIEGTDGNDTITGANAADRIDGREGNDILMGGGGGDTYVYKRGDGADSIVDRAGGQWSQGQLIPGGDNVLSFGPGITTNDIIPELNSATGQIVLDLGNGDRIDIGRHYDLAVQTVEFSDGTQYDIGSLLALQPVAVTGTSGDDYLAGSMFSNRIDGYAGNDTLLGGQSDDVLDGGTGNDYLAGGGGRDVYRYNAGDGEDTVSDWGGELGSNALGQPVWIDQPNTLRLGPGIASEAITPVWDGNRLTLNLGNGDSIAVDSLTDMAIQTLEFDSGVRMAMVDFLAQKGTLQLIGTAGNDVMATFANGLPLRGEGGDDQLFGSARDDVLEGGQGNDLLVGTAGDDTYCYNLGDGADMIVDRGSNTLSLGAGITPERIALRLDNESRDVMLDFGDGDSIDIGGTSDLAVESLQFADGTQLSVEQLVALKGGFVQTGTADDDWIEGTQLAERLDGLAGDDTIHGYEGNDVLTGGEGNDFLAGGDGDDTYIFNRGDGADTIEDRPWYWKGEMRAPETNTLVLGAGISPGEVDAVTDPNGRVTLSLGGGDSVRIGWRDQLAIQKIRFQDGRMFSVTSILSGAPDANSIADQTARQGDTFSFAVPANSFADFAGDSLSYAATLADGSPLPAWLDFDSATHTLSGMPGNSDVGDLDLAITATNGGGLSATAAFSLNVANVNDTPIVATPISDQFLVETSTLNFALPSGTFSDIDVGDRLALSATLVNGDPLPTWLAFDTTTASFSGTPGIGNLASLALRVTATDLAGAQASAGFNLNVVAAPAMTLVGTAAADTLCGFSGDDTLEGGAGNDWIVGGSGDDLLEGGTGRDGYVIDAQSGHDRIVETGNDGDYLILDGIRPDQLSFTRHAGDGDDLLISVAGTETSVLVDNWFNPASPVRFGFARFDSSDSNSTWWLADIDAAVWANNAAPTLVPIPVHQVMAGEHFQLDLAALARASDADGDLLMYSATLPEGAPLPSWLSFDVTNGALSGIPDTTQTDPLNIVFTVSDGGGLSSSINVDLTVLRPPVVGGGGDDTLHGTGGDDQLSGGGGNDQLWGGPGNDTYLFARGDGHDIVRQDDNNVGDVDVVRFATGISPNDVVVTEGGGGNDLVLTLQGTGESVTLAGWWNNPETRVSAVEFADGSVWDSNALIGRVVVLPVVGSGGNDHMMGTGGDDIMSGLGGDDTLFGDTGSDQLTGDDGDDELHGEGGNDHLAGGAGNDRLDGGDGADILSGGEGDDTLSGGPEDDTYLFARGDGRDVILQGNNTEGGRDVVRFQDGISPGDVSIAESGDDLVLRLQGPDEGMTLANWWNMPETRVSAVEFGDGTVWNAADLANRIVTLPIVGTEGGDVLIGCRCNDVISGLNGDDVLYGHGGNDTLAGGAGNDYLEDDQGSDVYIFNRGDGHDWVDDYDSTPGNIDTLRLGPDIAPTDVCLFRDEWSLYVAIVGTQDRIALGDMFDEEESRIERIEFADGTVWNFAEIEARIVTMPATEGDDILYGSDGNDLLAGLAGDDQMGGGGGNDILRGGDGNDYLGESAGNNVLDGGVGNDYLSVANGACFIAGGRGDDLIDLSTSDCVVAFNAGDGQDWIRVEAGMTAFTLSLGGGLGISQVAITRGHNSLQLQFGGGDDIHIDYGDWMSDLQSLPQITLQIVGDDIRTYDLKAALDLMVAHPAMLPAEALSASLLDIHATQAIGGALAVAHARNGGTDGLSLSAIHDVLADPSFGVAAQFFASSPIAGTDAADQLAGTDGGDTLVGGPGNDILAGGLGDDTYIFNPGDGIDRITDSGGSDTLAFGTGIDPGALTLGLGSLLVRTGNDTDAIHIEGFDPAAPLANPVIENFRFADGSVLSLDQLLARGFDITGDGELCGTSLVDRISGGAGDDILLGGAGDDTLKGGDGDDTYRFQRGDGNDTVIDIATATAGNRIAFGAGITRNDLALEREAGGLRLRYGATDSVLLAGQGAAGQRVVANLVFSDGSSASLDELADQAPVLIQAPVDQTATGGRAFRYALPAGSFTDADEGDVLTYAATLADGTSLPAWLTLDAATGVFSGTPANGDAGSLVIALTATDRVGQSAATHFTLTTGRSITGTGYNDTLAGSAWNDIISGMAGDDAIDGGAGSDTIIGGAGSDNLKGGAGDDTFQITGTDTGYDRFQGDDGFDSILGGDGDDTIRVNYYTGISTVERVDGGLGANVVAGTGYNDTLDFSGTELRNIARIDGGAGDDAITGSAGADTIIGGAGSDNLKGGGGDDTFLVTGTDAGYDRFQGDDGFDSILGGDGDDTIRINYYTGASTVERIDGGLGSNVIAGTGYNDTLDFSGTTLANIARIDGGAGDDAITGSNGADTIVGGAGSDNLKGGAGDDSFLIAGTDAGYDRFEGDDGFDTILGGDGDDTIRINYYTGASTVERIDGGAGSNVIAGTGYNDTLDFSATELVNIAKIDGGAGDDAITGNGGDNYLVGGLGNDRLTEAAGTDVLQAGAGNDVLVDTAGNNLLDGNTGNDTLTDGGGSSFLAGGAGNDAINTGNGRDVVAFNKGDGYDTVTAGAGGSETLSLGGGIAYGDLAFRKSGNDLVLDTGNGEGLTFKNWYAATPSRNVVDLQVIAEAMAGFDANAADPLLAKKVQDFDFLGLAGAFDTARAATPTLSSWALTNALAQFHLSSSDVSTLGGDLAYQYGKNGSLAGIGLTAAQQTLGDASFGAQTQALRPLTGLQEGVVRLS